MFKTLLSSLIFSLFALVAVPNSNYRFHTISPKGGLFYDGVTAIAQDSIGYVWIVTGNELFRYDGFTYKKYGDKFQKSFGKRWTIVDITTTSKGNLLVATKKALYEYNALSDCFSLFLAYPNISSFHKGGDGETMWLLSKGRTLSYQYSTNVLDTLNYNGRDVLNISNITSTEEGTFFATRYNRIYSLESDDKLNLFYTFGKDDQIVDIFLRRDCLWVLLKGEGLFCLDRANGEVIKRFDSYLNKGKFKGYEQCLYVDRDNQLWVGTQQGLLIIDAEDGTSETYRHQNNRNYSLPNNSIWKIVADGQDNIWLGTYAGGLCYVNLAERNWFNTYNSVNSDLSGDMVSSFAESDKYLWVGTEGAGLNRIDKVTQEIKKYRYRVGAKNSLPHNNIKSLLLTPEDDLWIAMFKGGISRFDTKRELFENFTTKENSKYHLLANDLRKLVYDPRGGIWVAYQKKEVAISYIDLKRQLITHYDYPDRDYVLDLVLNKSGDPIFITRSSIYALAADHSKIEKRRAISDLKFLNAQSCFYDKSGDLWIGTTYNGLWRGKIANKEVYLTQMAEATNYTSITSIVEDKEGIIWYGTDNGLHNWGGANASFGADEGFQGDVFYPLSVLVSKCNENIYFGGTNGFTTFNPYISNTNTIAPKAIIAEIFIDNEPFAPDMLHQKEVSVGHEARNFGFTLASDNFLMPTKSLFRYRLRGYDDRWQEVSANARFIQFTKVPPGRYSLEVMVANGDGLWSDTPLILPLVKEQSPWLKWPAFVLYILLFLLLLGGILYYYYDKQKLKLQLYLKSVEREKQQVLYDSRIQFFTNISHDFRTPLSLILGVIDNLKQEGIKTYYYQVLRNNSNRLLNLVNELMDFRKVESGHLKLKPQSCHINSLLRPIANDFSDSFLKRGITFVTKYDEELDNIGVNIDKNILEKIVLNLLNNAYKYTSKGEVVLITLGKDRPFESTYKFSYRVGSIKGESISIVIRDTGVGISKESISTVFERFYQVKSTNEEHLGTGVGLALVKSLVQLHQGEIIIYSERDKGTDFVIRIPLVEAQYQGEAHQDEAEDRSANDILIYDPAVTEKVETDGLLLNEKRRILVVEDHADLRALLIQYLSAYYEVHGLADGSEVADFLIKQDVDLVISDIMMPIKDGVTLCREMKSSVETSHIPFILLTAKTGLDNKVEGVGSGADLYLEKPIDFALLLISIGNIFKQQKKLRDHYAKNFFAEDTELLANKHDNDFLKQLVEVVDVNMKSNNLDVNFISSEMGMSRSKLYSKLKALTGKSIVEFILEYKLRKAARIMVESKLSIAEVMDVIGIKSQSYFTTAFKREFGETPSAFILKHKKE